MLLEAHVNRFVQSGECSTPRVRCKRTVAESQEVEIRVDDADSVCVRMIEGGVSSREVCCREKMEQGGRG